ncbi:acyltransferase family protein [Acinetobacter baumannii]|uniref:acyltransferase family protein n=2 Tax=Acinetobacter baumannii TaxID=470 RepID=UPI000DE5DB3A|nr:acyltransferase family protein [Acinetobacter baumannii]ELN8904281.1 acyltransferase [Acinetobacter baumannii]ELT0788659.1 acyltransferase [Acinetobacter baumannii]MCL6184752.1 acyltransferase [Acinetobacter baumannii]MCL6191650.1 acyltransferase [Acinetobacter baumannii]MDC5305708.1 acyltransferase [Acinetobacter baumannii]
MSIKYRNEIDGLRAIAVLFVFFNHLNISLFKGGFIGVDIFFVISGFLITMIIRKEIENKSFTILNFYRKRIIRIAPAYFLVLMIVSSISFFILTPSELISYIKSALSSALFVSNFYFWKNVGGYFSDNTHETFLLHFWSLSVEEQFYLLWPIFLIILMSIIKNRKIFLFTFFILLIFLIAVSEFMAINYSSMAYYFPFSRAFELFVGASLVFIKNNNIKTQKSNIFYFFSILTLFFCAFFYSENTKFPGLFALLPCLATALIIYLNNSNSIFYKFLSCSLMRFFGKISYPMYLWHWPIIVVFNILLIEINFKIGLFIFTSTVVLSYLTFKFVEKPIQQISYNWSNRKVIFLGYFLPSSFILILCLGIIYYNGFPYRFNNSVIKSDKALSTMPSKIRAKCHSSSIDINKISTECNLGYLNKGNAEFLMIGDSISNHFTGMIDVFAKDAKVKVNDFTQDRTIFLPHTKMLTSTGIEYKKFRERNDDIVNLIKLGRYKNVILGGSYYNVFNSADSYISLHPIKGMNAVESGLINAVSLIVDSGANPIIIKPNPSLGDLNNKCIMRNDMFNLGRNCTINIEKFHEQSRSFDIFIEKLRLKFPQLEIIDVTKVLCDKRYCKSSINNIPLYRDKNHLNNDGAILIANEYIKIFKNPLKN